MKKNHLYKSVENVLLKHSRNEASLDEMASTLETLYNSLKEDDCEEEIKMQWVNYDRISDIIWKLDTNAVFTNISKSVSKVLGYKPNDIIGKPVLQFIHESQHAKAQNMIRLKIEEKGEDLDYTDYLMVAQNGSLIPCEVSSAAIYDADKKLTGFIGITRDMSRRIAIEDQLRETQARFESFMNHFPGASFIKTKDEQLIYCNEKFAELLGKTPDEIIGTKKHLKVLPASLHQRYLDENNQILKEYKTLNVESTFPGPEGNTQWLTVKFPLQGPNDQKLIGGISIEITDRKNIENKLRTEEERSSFIAETALELSTLAPEVDIYQYIAVKTREIIENSGIVITTDLNSETHEWRIKAVEGISNTLKAVTSLLGKNVKELHGKSNPELMNQFSDIHLKELGTDLHFLSQGSIPGKIANSLLKLLKINHIYGISFIEGDNQFGNLTLLTSKPIVESQKKTIEAFVLQTSNIFKSKIAISKLHESEEKYRTLFNKSASPNILMENNRFVDVNDKTVSMLGYKSKDELIGITPWEISPQFQPDGQSSKEKAKQVLQQAIRDGFVNFEWLHVDANGNEIWFDISLTRIKKAGTNQIYVVMHNINERKLATEEMKVLNRILAEMGRMAKVGGWEFNPENGTGTWTEEVANIHDVDIKEIPTVNFGVEFYTPESKAKIMKAIEELNTNGKPYDLELQLITAKGNKKWVRTIGKPVFKDDQIKKAVGSFQDITERKEFEMEITKYRDHLEELVKERTNELEAKNLELEEKNEELEHFNKLFVGREFRIKELKQKIAELETKLLG